MSDCQPFDGAKNRCGYGVVCIGGKTVLAHRLAWALHNGADPSGFVVMHTCDNPACLNPEHLRLGTQRENVLDMHHKGRHPSDKYSKEDVARIKEMLADGWPNADIANEIGCSTHMVSDIKRGRVRVDR